jgi:hypothetical protein
MPPLPKMQQLIGHWLGQKLDLTGNNKAETLFTISPEALAGLNPGAKAVKSQQQPRTIIFSDGGSIIYTDFGKKPQQSLSAIAKLAEVESLALLVADSNGYNLKRWSGKNQRFE